MDKERPWYNSWRTLATVLFISCIGILIRSCFRVAELSQGFDGFLTTNQALFYLLDTLPLLIAISVFVPFWPGRFIPAQTEELNPSSLTLAGTEGEVKDVKV